MTVTDQTGFTFELNYTPQRIISLVPSQTELLFDLGLEDKIVGVTKFCIHPFDKVKKKEKIGGTKNFNFEKIDSLKPDLIIGNKEENYKDGIEELRKRYPVWLSDIYNLEDALNSIKQIGFITGKVDLSLNLVENITSSFQSLQNKTLPLKVTYFIWRDPYMVAASETFIHNMLQSCGFKNVFDDLSRYPNISPEDLVRKSPEILLLSSEPYPFTEAHLEEFRKLCPSAYVKLVDGEMFSWYGSRLRFTPDYLKQLQNELINLPTRPG